MRKIKERGRKDWKVVGGYLVCENRSEEKFLVRFYEAALAESDRKRIGKKRSTECFKKMRSWIWG